MQLIIDTYKNTGRLHHAYCIEGDSEAVLPMLTSFLETELRFSPIGNPDFSFQTFDSFGIDDGRRIKEIHSTRAFRNDSRKVFVIVTNTITREAQNSLLKIFEEPGEGNHFFIIMPSASILLPTLLSRVIVVEGSRAGKARAADKAALFISASIKTRMEFVKELLLEVSNEEKTKSDILHFLNEVEKAFYKKRDILTWTKHEAEYIETFLKFKKYLLDRSSSAKMILEHIALTFPR